MFLSNFIKQNYFYLSASFLITSLYILLNGYDFNTGDQAEHLPQVYKLLNPNLYKTDFFLVLYHQTFTVRHFWVMLVYATSFVFGVKLSCFLLYFICSYFTVFAWAKIASLFSINKDKKTSILLSLLSIFLFFNAYTIGGNNVLAKIFIGSSLAELFAAWALYFFFTKKIYLSALLLALSVWFQALVGLQLFLVLVGILFFTNTLIDIKKNSISLLKFVCIFIACSLPMLFPLLHAQYINNIGLNSQVFYMLLYFKRAPWHYVPQAFSNMEYMCFGFLLLFSLPMFWYIKNKLLRQQTILFFVLILSVCLCYMAAFYTNSFMWIGKLQWFKTTIWINAFCCILLSSFLSKYIGKISFAWFNKLAIILSIILFVFMFYIDAFTSSTRYSFINPNPKTDLQLMHQYININTPINARFLIPIDNESFACEAKRANVASFKAVVHEPYFFVAWQKALEKFYRVDFTSSIFTKTQAVSNYYTNYDTSQFIHYNYRLDDTTSSKILPLLQHKIHTQGKWVLSKVR